MADPNAPSENQLTQVSYKETDYADASYEIIGEVSSEQNFVPEDFEVIERPQVTVDPMFQDFGGSQSSGSPKRWHLPEDLGGISSTPKGEKEKIDDDHVRLSKNELETLKNEAFQSGKAIGAQETKAASDERLKVLEARIAQVFNDLRSQLGGVVSSMEQSAVQLALNISQKIIGFAVEINPEYLTHVVQEAFKQVGTAAIRKIRVSPEDMEFIEVVGLEKQLKEHDGSWKFEKDETIKSGCIVDTSAGEIDYQLDKAWERAKNSIIKAVR